MHDGLHPQEGLSDWGINDRYKSLSQLRAPKELRCLIQQPQATAGCQALELWLSQWKKAECIKHTLDFDILLLIFKTFVTC